MLTALFDRIVDRGLLVRRMYVVANRVQREQDVRAEPEYVQLDLFPMRRLLLCSVRSRLRVNVSGACRALCWLSAKNTEKTPF